MLIVIFCFLFGLYPPVKTFLCDADQEKNFDRDVASEEKRLASVDNPEKERKREKLDGE